MVVLLILRQPWFEITSPVLEEETTMNYEEFSAWIPTWMGSVCKCTMCKSMDILFSSKFKVYWQNQQKTCFWQLTTQMNNNVMAYIHLAKEKKYYKGKK